jgi:hypothetical protein
VASRLARGGAAEPSMAATNVLSRSWVVTSS